MSKNIIMDEFTIVNRKVNFLKPDRLNSWQEPRLSKKKFVLTLDVYMLLMFTFYYNKKIKVESVLVIVRPSFNTSQRKHDVTCLTTRMF